MPALDELKGNLEAIERALADGTYRPGPWRQVVDRVENLSPAERQGLAADLTRVSDRLHLRKKRIRIGVLGALLLESAAAIIGGLLLAAAIASTSNVKGIIALVLLVSSFEPLLKVGTGTALGLSYSYAYLYRLVEPRFKMAFGSYLALSPLRRATLHVVGMIGSPLAALLVTWIASGVLPGTARIAFWVFWLLVLINLVAFIAELVGLRNKLLRPALSSGGMAALELRRAFGGQPG